MDLSPLVLFICGGNTMGILTRIQTVKLTGGGGSLLYAKWKLEQLSSSGITPRFICLKDGLKTYQAFLNGEKLQLVPDKNLELTYHRIAPVPSIKETKTPSHFEMALSIAEGNDTYRNRFFLLPREVREEAIQNARLALLERKTQILER